MVHVVNQCFYFVQQTQKHAQLSENNLSRKNTVKISKCKIYFNAAFKCMNFLLYPHK